MKIAVYYRRTSQPPERRKAQGVAGVQNSCSIFYVKKWLQPVSDISAKLSALTMQKYCKMRGATGSLKKLPFLTCVTRATMPTGRQNYKLQRDLIMPKGSKQPEQIPRQLIGIYLFPLPPFLPSDSYAPPPRNQQAVPHHSAAPAHQNLLNYPPLGSSSLDFTNQPLPDIDLNSMMSSYNKVKESNSQPKILTDMYGILIHIASKQRETEGLKDDIRSHTERLDRLETKIGGTEEVSERLSIAIRNLPLPLPGGDDLTCVRNALHELRAPGVDVYHDIVKAVRKLSGNNPSNLLGTVLVELRNEESKKVELR